VEGFDVFCAVAKEVDVGSFYIDTLALIPLPYTLNCILLDPVPLAEDIW